MIREPLTLFDFTPLSLGGDGQFQPMGTGRLPGVHWSDIVKEMKIYAGEKVDSVEGEQTWFRAQVGFLWERAIEIAFKEYMGVQRLQVEKQPKLPPIDRIYMSPDAFDQVTGDLEEYKATWRTARKWVEDIEGNFWSWLVQVKGYLHGLSIVHGVPRRSVRFYTMFLNGDYKRKTHDELPMGVYTERLTFTDEEIEETWKIGLRYRDLIEKRRREEGE